MRLYRRKGFAVYWHLRWRFRWQHEKPDDSYRPQTIETIDAPMLPDGVMEQLGIATPAKPPRQREKFVAAFGPLEIRWTK